MNHEKMRAEQQRLQQEIVGLQKKIENLPRGKLICARNGKYTKWYQSNGHSAAYIPKKNKELAEQLAVKKYLSAQMKELMQEEQAISCYLRRCPQKKYTEELFSEKSLYSELLTSYFQPASQALQDWMTEPYDRNPKYPEQCIQKTSAGIFVRSKSEALIVMILQTKKIPFRYECALQLGETIVYPDFTIRHPRTDELYYWEHFGMMDNPVYSKNAFSKLQLYSSYGIFPTHNLLVTYEAKEVPLDITRAEQLADDYLCN